MFKNDREVARYYGVCPDCGYPPNLEGRCLCNAPEPPQEVYNPDTDVDGDGSSREDYDRHQQWLKEMDDQDTLRLAEELLDDEGSVHWDPDTRPCLECGAREYEVDDGTRGAQGRVVCTRCSAPFEETPAHHYHEEDCGCPACLKEWDRVLKEAQARDAARQADEDIPF